VPEGAYDEPDEWELAAAAAAAASSSSPTGSTSSYRGLAKLVDNVGDMTDTNALQTALNSALNVEEVGVCGRGRAWVGMGVGAQACVCVRTCMRMGVGVRACRWLLARCKLRLSTTG